MATGEKTRSRRPGLGGRATRAWETHPHLLLVGGALALAALSLLAPSSPGYDPWAWIVWGREVAHLDLDTAKGPSWKPLPVAFTTVFSLFGGAAPALWIVVTRAAGIVTVVVAFRVAARLSERAKVLAGIVAAGGVLLILGFLESVTRGWSEFLLAALLLLAVERHLDGGRRSAFALIFAASLIRPEVWPFLGLYGLYLWRRDRGSRYLVVLLLALVPVLWLGPDLIVSGDPLRSQRRAQQALPGRPSLSEHPAWEVLRQGRELVLGPLLVLAAVALAVAAVAFVRRRREGATLVLGLGCLGWIATVAVMSERGYTGNPRYLLPAAAFVCVLAGVGAAWLAGLAEVYAERRWTRPGATRAAGVAVSVVLLAALVPSASRAVDRIDSDADRIRSEREISTDLDAALARVGGRDRALACGRVFTGSFEFPMLAWALEIHLRDLATVPTPPGIVFRARPGPTPERPFELSTRTARWEVFEACRR